MVRSAKKFAWTHRVVVVKRVKNVYRMQMAVSSVNVDQITKGSMANAISVQGPRNKEDWLM